MALLSFGILLFSNMSAKRIERIVTAIKTLEGEGFMVTRPFPTRTFDHFDPFLLLDEAGPVEYGPGEAKGAPEHPHRGFETVTYIIEGELLNWDSTGFSGVLKPGDVEWTTAGAGIIHGGSATEGILKNGGKMHIIQLWVNLATNKKFIPPQSTNATTELVQLGDGVSARVILGSFAGVRAPIATTTPSLFLHLKLAAGAQLSTAIDPSFNSFAFVMRGEGLFGAEKTKGIEGQMLIFSMEGETAEINNDSAEELKILLLAGEPLNEPVARYGPFVMNTRQEIVEAVEDYQAGKFGAPRGA